MDGDAGRAQWEWLLGDGIGRGIALIFLVAGLVMVVFGAGAFLTRSYRLLSRQYATSTVNADVAVGEGADPHRDGDALDPFAVRSGAASVGADVDPRVAEAPVDRTGGSVSAMGGSVSAAAATAAADPGRGGATEPDVDPR